jgi:hypothetical protein
MPGHFYDAKHFAEVQEQGLNPGMIKKSKGKVVPVLSQAPRHEDILEKWRYSSTHS